MSAKREEMRRKAKQELHKKGIEPLEEETAKPPEDPPSLFRSFLMIFFGTLVTFYFINAGSFILGLFAGLPFIIIGTFRINKASMINSKASNRTNL